MAHTPEKLHGKLFADYMSFIDNVVNTQFDVFYSKLIAGIDCSGTETAKLAIIHYLLNKYSNVEENVEALDCIYNHRPFLGLVDADYTTEDALNTYTYLETFTNYLQKNYKQCGTTKIIVRTMPTGTSPFTLTPSGGIEVSTDGTTFSTDSIIVQGGDTVYIKATASCTECGKSAYEIWLDLGNEGTEQDFIDSLTGPEGPPGENANIEGLTWRGNWTVSPSPAYAINDAVQYNGTSYVKIGTGGNASLPPNDAANLNVSWEVLALQGMQGDDGAPGAPGTNGAFGVGGFRNIGSATSSWTLTATNALGTSGLRPLNPQTPIDQTITTLTNDAGVVITFSIGTACSLEIPNVLPNFPVGYQVTVMQLGAGQVQIKPVTSGTATISSANSMKYLRTQYSAATMIKVSAGNGSTTSDVWYLFGDLTNIV
jgi:hypothetical protein